MENLIFLLYRLLRLLGLPFIVAYFAIRGARDKGYFKGFGERLGFIPVPAETTVPGCIWLHAVSVGEVVSAVELIRRLKADFPATAIRVSVSTVAGRAMAEQRLKGLADTVFHAPLDYVSCVRRVIRRARPAILIVLETEIWPNLYRETRRAGCGLIVVNGRISGKAFPKYKRWRYLFAPVLALPHRILAQSKQDVDRYAALGAAAIDVGNLKYDFDPRSAAVPTVIQAVIDATAPERIWIAASTMPPASEGDIDEDDLLISAYKKVVARHPRSMLIHVPRKPERFDAAAQKISAAGIMFLRRSYIQSGEKLPLPCAILIDTIGELSGLFQVADVVFMGGTFPRRGGHNILEPAFFAKPVIAGPHMENFAAIAEEFTAAGALIRADGADDLAEAIGDLFDDPGACADIGSRALALAESKRGATARVAAHVAEVYDAAVPRGSRWWNPLWFAGTRIHRRLTTPKKLRTPVVSVGGIAMGGVGKTPFVLWLAAALQAQGLKPAILTRGHGRTDPEDHTIVAPGQPATVARTGDEAQIFVRAGIAPVGIGSDRHAVGRLIEERFQPDVFLIDDGFQHWALARDLDIVLLNAIEPLAGGFLREPPSALRRAGAVVISRAQAGRSYPGLRKLTSAPVYTSRVIPGAWTGWNGSCPPAAFCGLGNPASFWKTLGELGVEPRFRWAFDDHHRYKPEELKRLAARARDAGAEVLLTTEKDAMNLPEGDLPMPVAWLKIGIAVDEAESLLELIRLKIQ